MNISTPFIAIASGVIGLGVIGAPVGYVVASYQNEQVRTCTVESKDRTRTEEGSDHRVYTDCGNFKVADAVFKRNFHSSDTYRDIEVGETYSLTTIGFRIPLLSEFPNIVEVN